jgi:hypothetical protein
MSRRRIAIVGYKHYIKDITRSILRKLIDIESSNFNIDKVTEIKHQKATQQFEQL